MNSPRYNPSEFETFLVVPEAEPAPSLEWEFTLDPHAEPPVDKFRLLSEIDPSFLRSWEHRRTDLQDQSASAYDCSLATKALNAGWTAQEIVNLLIAHRRKHGDNPKLRKDYYDRTLNRATTGVHEERRNQTAEDLKAGKEMPEDVAQDPAEVFAVLSRSLGISITKLVRYRSEPNSYQVQINGRLINVAAIEQLSTQVRFRNLVLDHTDVLIPRIKAIDWDGIVNKLFLHIENVDVVGGTNQMSIDNWIDLYLSDGVAQEPQWEEAALGYRPFTRKGVTYFVGEGFRLFLIQRLHEKITSRTLASDLTKLGYEYERAYIITKRNARTSRGVWKVLRH